VDTGYFKTTTPEQLEYIEKVKGAESMYLKKKVAAECYDKKQRKEKAEDEVQYRFDQEAK